MFFWFVFVCLGGKGIDGVCTPLPTQPQQHCSNKEGLGTFKAILSCHEMILLTSVLCISYNATLFKR